MQMDNRVHLDQQNPFMPPFQGQDAGRMQMQQLGLGFGNDDLPNLPNIFPPHGMYTPETGPFGHYNFAPDAADYHQQFMAQMTASAAVLASMQSAAGLGMADPHLLLAQSYHKGKGKGGFGKGKDPWGKGKGKGAGRDDRKGRKGGGRKTAAQPAENLNDARDEPLPDGCGDLLRKLRRQGDASGLKLYDLGADVIEFATDQYGSAFLMMELNVTQDEGDINGLFGQLLQKMDKLATDPFGSCVIQKLLDHPKCGVECKRTFAKKISGSIYKLSVDLYGCRVVQKVLDEVSTDQQVSLVNELSGHVVECIEDQHGNHVVQKCIHTLPPESIGFIVEELITRLDDMAIHCYGCRVVQRVLEHGSQSQTEPLLDKLYLKVESLVKDTYGNYVVQHILEHGREKDKQNIMSLILKDPFDLACGQFSSNVVEKSLVVLSKDEKSKIIKAFLGDPEDPQRLSRMVNHRFANYVVQRLLDSAEQPERQEAFYKLVVECADTSTLNQLKKSNYGKHILQKLRGIATTLGPQALAQFTNVVGQ
jgi:pumilio RNA-binding family